jgi:hypothetical protein
MSTYVFNTSNASVTTSANIATDRVRIATVDSILYAVGFPNTAGTGNITAATNTTTVTGSGTSFTTQLGKGYWIGNATGTTVGIISSIANNTSLTLTANASVAVSNAAFTYSPYGVPYVDDTLDPSNCPTASGIIPANTIVNTVIVGQGNVVTFVSVGANSQISITELGEPHANTGTTGY